MLKHLMFTALFAVMLPIVDDTEVGALDQRSW